MSQLLATQPNSAAPANALTNGSPQPSYPAQAEVSNTFTPSDIAERFAELQRNMAQLLEYVGTINANITQLTSNTNQNTIAISQITLASAQNTQTLAQNTNDIAQIKNDISVMKATSIKILKLMSPKTKKINCVYVYFSLFKKYLCGCLVLTSDLSNSESNSQARIANSHANFIADPLHPISNTGTFTYPQHFPATLGELNQLDGKYIAHRSLIQVNMICK